MKKILIVKDTLELSGDRLVHCSPFYTIHSIDHNIISRIYHRKQLLITSRNGVIALMANLITFDCISFFKDKKIMIVGSQTYKLLDSYGFSNLSDPFNNIQSLVLSTGLNKSLYLSGFDTSFNQSQEYGIEREIIYKAIERNIPFKIIQQVLDGHISNILLYSCRGANIFLKSFPRDYDFNGINFICISESVASIVVKYNPKYPTIPLESEMLELIN